ncbi:MAG: site-specific integrase [Ruminococcus sp.]|jgi:integrase|nr:site-specific integrase [Ruminococcus sp.]
MATIERNIYLRSDGRYEARYAQGKDEAGRTRYSAVYARTLEGVKDKLNAAIAVIVVLPEKPKLTVVKALERHLETESIRLKPSTVCVYRNYIKNYIQTFFGDMPVEVLSQTILQDFVIRQIDNGLSALVVQSVFNFLKAGLPEKQGIWDVVLPKSVKHKAEFLSLFEQKQLEESAKRYGGGTYLAIMLCLYTGLRIGEVIGLRREDIDFERKTIAIRRTIQRIKSENSGQKTEIVALSPKSQSSNRVIPLPAFIAELLKSTTVSGYIISGSDKPIEPRTLQYRFKRLLSLSGIRSVNFHTTRHTFAARALEQGFDVKTLSEIMGHSSAAVTLNKYAHISDECKRHHMESLVGVFDQNGDQM